MNDPDAYVILIGPTPDGHYGAWAPDLPGCIALGDTAEETEREMREAIAFHLEGLREDGLSPPQPTPCTPQGRSSANARQFHYTYRVAWSAEDGEFLATCTEFPSLSWLAPSPVEALDGLKNLLGEVIAGMEELGEEVPQPLDERT